MNEDTPRTMHKLQSLGECTQQPSKAGAGTHPLLLGLGEDPAGGLGIAGNLGHRHGRRRCRVAAADGGYRRRRRRYRHRAGRQGAHGDGGDEQRSGLHPCLAVLLLCCFAAIGTKSRARGFRVEINAFVRHALLRSRARIARKMNL